MLVNSLFIVCLLFGAGLTACNSNDSGDAIASAERFLAEGDYPAARASAFDASGDEKYDLLKKIDARKEEADTQRAEVKFSIDHAYQEGREKVQKNLERIQKATKDRNVKSEASAAIAGLDKLFANQPKPEPIPANVPRPGVVESEPHKVIRTLDTKPPDDSLKKKTSMAPSLRVKEVLEAAESDVNRWHYRQALELLSMAASEMGDEEQKYIQSTTEEIKNAASQALAALVSEATSDFGNREASIEKLYSRLNDFPQTDELQQLRTILEPVVNGMSDATKIAFGAIGATHKPTRTVPGKRHGSKGSWLPSEAGIDELFAKAETANDAWDFAGAKNMYILATERASLEILKTEARSRAADMERLAGLIESINAAIIKDPDNYKNFDPGTGRRGQLTGAGAAGLAINAGAGAENISFGAISGAAWKALFGKSSTLAPDRKIAASILLARANFIKDADQLLKEAADGDSSLQPQIDGVLARRRGIETPSYGFVWYNNQWLTFKDRENIKLAGKIKDLLARIETAGTPREREMFTNELSKMGAEAGEALEIALKDKKVEITKRIASLGLVKRVSALREERVALDKARQHALELIFDEEKYFYPYRPPECPAEKAKLYAPVQHEVSKRVAAVMELWNSKTAVPLGSAQMPLRMLHELEGRIRAMHVFDAENSDDTNLFLSIDPSLSELTVRTICNSQEEYRFVYEYNRRMRMFNASAKSDMTKEEIVCAELTNGYREIMGRKLLAYNNKLIHSAQKHSRWMGDTGQLSHFSTLEGARSPFERMRNENYARGVSENIAYAAGPDGAFLGWQHSSGHHRNMLMPNHIEFGIGGNGAYWTQNFGVDSEYKVNAAWRD
ncbi:MAG: CAP domain-containing protein [Planctomycetes bacterium]|nr:CAP domain-containing protein [Planctomycetota bacterium]